MKFFFLLKKAAALLTFSFLFSSNLFAYEWTKRGLEETCLQQARFHQQPENIAKAACPCLANEVQNNPLIGQDVKDHLGAVVEAGDMTPEAQEFYETHKAALNGLGLMLFARCSATVDPKILEPYLKKNFPQLLKSPTPANKRRAS